MDCNEQAACGQMIGSDSTSLEGSSLIRGISSQCSRLRFATAPTPPNVTSVQVMSDIDPRLATACHNGNDTNAIHMSPATLTDDSMLDRTVDNFQAHCCERLMTDLDCLAARHWL